MRKIFNLVILLTLLTGLAACGAQPEPTTAPTEVAADPTATAVVPTTQPGTFSQEQLIEDLWQLVDIIDSTYAVERLAH